MHIRSYSKSHGPDLRLAAVGGAGDVVTAVTNRRLLGPGWSSRILQAVLLEMLDDAPTIASGHHRRESSTPVAANWSPRCSSRAAVAVTGTDGINMWMTVADERSALVTLAAQGIGAAPGEPFQVRRDTPAPARHGRPDRARPRANRQPTRGGGRRLTLTTRASVDAVGAMGIRSWLFERDRTARHRDPITSSRSPGCRCGSASWRLHDLWENDIPATMAEDHTSMLRFAAREPMGRIFVMEVRAETARAAIKECLGIEPPKQDR